MIHSDKLCKQDFLMVLIFNDKSMPIKPENKSRYPKDWKQIRASVLERSHNCCEFCGVENYTYRTNERTGNTARFVLTVVHLDHTQYL